MLRGGSFGPVGGIDSGKGFDSGRGFGGGAALADIGEWAAERGRGRDLTPAQVGDQLFQGHDPDVTFPDGFSDALQCLVGRPHVIPPRRARRPEQDDVGGGDWAKVERGMIGALGGQFAAAPRGEEDHGDQDDEADDQ
jgi:hypothetical protein